MSCMHKLNKKRPAWSHKGDFGKVLVIGGSEKYSGSPIFNGLAALRAGADLATLTGHPRAMNAAAAYSPDLITIPLKGDLDQKSAKQILKSLNDFDSIVIGGGLARTKKSHKAILQIIEKANLPMVIDAEAIHAIAGHTEILKNKKIVITPHDEEFRVLTGVKLTTDLKLRAQTVEKWAAKLGVTILLKGHVDVISDGKKTLLNRSGSVFMTKGGTGDTLAGISAAFLAQGMSPLDAAFKAANVNGKAGEYAAAKFGASMLASDLILEIGKAMKC